MSGNEQGSKEKAIILVVAKSLWVHRHTKFIICLKIWDTTVNSTNIT